MILFVAYRVEDGNPTVALYTIGTDGNDRQKIPIPLRNAAPLGGAWMPDGEHIIFAVEIYR
jgi:hypothetical protein